MDREQEDMQFLGLFGIYKESYKLIISWRKIFSQITLSLILPLSFIFLFHIEVSDILLDKIDYNVRVLDHTPHNSPRRTKISDAISSEWIAFFLFKAAYLTFFLIFSLLSTSAVVYTVACIYTARDVTFKKVMSVVPKVWKRLMVTFLVAFLATFIYHVILFIVLIIWIILFVYTKAERPIFVIIMICYMVGSVYLTIIWHLASVISVLEDVRGIRAMMKSKELIKGNMWIAIIVFFKLIFLLSVVQFLFKALVVRGDSGLASRVGFGILCFLMLFKLVLFGLVIQTVIYFVCKSYHHENIDKSSLSDHLEVYLGDYVPLTAKDVQLEHFYV